MWGRKQSVLHQKNKADDRATLYRATINGDSKSKGIKSKSVKIIAENIKGLNHANGMTAVKSGSTTHLFIAPGKAKGYILHLKVKKNKVTNKKGKASRIVFPSGMGSYKATGISSFVKDKKRYYILRQGNDQRIVQIDLKDFKMTYVSKFKLPNSDSSGDKQFLSGQGSTCECDYKGFYYIPRSYISEADVKDKSPKGKKDENAARYNSSMRKTSYVDVYKLDICNVQNVEAYYAGSYKLTAGGKGRAVKWKKGKRKGRCVKFELEDLYVKGNTGMMYFNSEGGADCHDFLGRANVN